MAPFRDSQIPIFSPFECTKSVRFLKPEGNFLSETGMVPSLRRAAAVPPLLLAMAVSGGQPSSMSRYS